MTALNLGGADERRVQAGATEQAESGLLEKFTP
jgi:hypothetical protein